jgi:hypothetical protein
MKHRHSHNLFWFRLDCDLVHELFIDGLVGFVDFYFDFDYHVKRLRTESAFFFSFKKLLCHFFIGSSVILMSTNQIIASGPLHVGVAPS